MTTTSKKTKRTDYVTLQEKLENAVKKRIPINETIGIAFSAGVDSGTIAYVVRKFSKKAVLVTVGVKGSADIARAEPFAKKWKMKWFKKILTPTEIEENFVQAGKVLKTRDQLQQTLGAVNLSIAELASENGIKTLFVGSGADELFCGYGAFDALRNDPSGCEKLRTEKVENVEEHDVKREIKCGKQYGVKIIAPFLDERFAAEALKTPAIENLRGKYGNVRKNALRMLAEKMGVPKAIVSAPKKAMQYGSGVNKAVLKIKETSS